jgi:AraC-like DNA-binding protein
MSVKSCSLQIDTGQYENDNRGTPMFPCGGYVTTVGDHITERLPWHWHEEIEIMVVTGGALKLDVPDRTMVLEEGEAVFINSSVLHTAVNVGRSVCEIKSFVFAPRLIYGELESAVEQKYVRPLIHCPQLSAIHFQKDIQWHREVIRCMEEAFVLYEEEKFGYEILVRECLSKLWFLIVSNQWSELTQYRNSQNTETVRVKEMLAYIHEHYAEVISLKNIAGSAAVSERECLRCFNNVLGTTPMKYLLSHRISVAAGLLTNSDFNITEICKLSGFESPSYFSLKFKALTDKTPSEYRQLGKRV